LLIFEIEFRKKTRMKGKKHEGRIGKNTIFAGYKAVGNNSGIR